MKGKTAPLLVYLALAGLALFQLFNYLPQLPGEVVTQYTVSGDPDTTLSKAALTTIFLVVLFGCTAYFLGFGLLLHKLPDRYFKVLPNKDHWLAPEHRAETHLSISKSLLWLGNATLTMFLGTFQIIFMTATGHGIGIDPGTASSLVTTLYLTYVLFMVMHLKNRFRVNKK